MNTGRLFISLVAILGFAISGCSKPAAETSKQHDPPPVTTDMEIVVPDSKTDDG